VLENSDYKLYYDRYKTTDRTVYKNRPDIVRLDTTIKEAYLKDVAAREVPQTFRLERKS
jgi:hypothetical protein